jgi:hypothetical protein
LILTTSAGETSTAERLLPPKAAGVKARGFLNAFDSVVVVVGGGGGGGLRRVSARSSGF